MNALSDSAVVELETELINLAYCLLWRYSRQFLLSILLPLRPAAILFSARRIIHNSGGKGPIP
jgi:hypothetical protein